MAKVVAIANQKGGVGKTTTAVNLAASLAVAEQRTLLIDGDPQGNASSGVGLTRETIAKTVYDVLIGSASLEEVTHRAIQFKHLDVAPATADLAAAEVELVDQQDRDRAMRNAIATVRDRYDYILIDCPPSLGLITINMLVAADAILIPVQCEYYALEGLSQLLNTVNLVQRSANQALKIEGVLLTMYDARLNLSRQVAADAREFFGSQVYNSVIPRNIRLAEAPSFGKPIVVYDVASVGAQTYMAVARELILRNSPVVPAIAGAQHAQHDSADTPYTGSDQQTTTTVSGSVPAHSTEPGAIGHHAPTDTSPDATVADQPAEPLVPSAVSSKQSADEGTSDATSSPATLPPTDVQDSSQRISGDHSERNEEVRPVDLAQTISRDHDIDAESVVFQSTTVEVVTADTPGTPRVTEDQLPDPDSSKDHPDQKSGAESPIGLA